MKKIIQIIPHLITSGNLFCGCLAIINVLAGDLIMAAYLVGLAAFLDFFDGFAARALGVSGEFGKQLDSLADCVTFGVVPGMVMMVLIERSFVLESANLTPTEPQPCNQIPYLFIYPAHFASYLALLVPVFSAIRLAKFNLDTRQSHAFIGLPTPANSIFMISLGYLAAAQTSDAATKNLILNLWFLIPVTLIFSFLLVAELPLFALKFKTYKWAGNEIRYLFLITSVLLLILLKMTGLPVIILVYIAFSTIENLLQKKKT